jgi:uncharacterized protein (TIGR03435 family)
MKHIFIVLMVMPFLSRPQESQKLSFEVASVKPGRAGSVSVGPLGGRFVATSATLKLLLQRAYASPSGRALLRSQVLGGPAWIDTDTFDIDAKAEADSRPTPDQLWLMARTLLEERFQLKTHREPREMPVYNLVVVKSGKLKLSEDQTPVDSAAPGIFGPSGGPPRGGFRVIAKPSEAALTLVMSGNAVRMETLINILQAYADRPVNDKTGLTGLYDVQLQFDLASGNSLGAPGAAPVASDPGIGIANMYTAIQENLGLKLEPARGLVDVLVIDSVQKPSEN